METRSIPDAAARVGISPRSMYRWLGDPLFRAELAQAEGMAIATAERNLVRLADSALAIIHNILGDTDANAGVRLRAAQMVLDNLIHLRELETFEARLAILEKRVLYGQQN